MKRFALALAVAASLAGLGVAYAQFGGGQTGIGGCGPQVGGPNGCGPQVGGGPMTPPTGGGGYVPPSGCTPTGLDFSQACNSMYVAVIK